MNIKFLVLALALTLHISAQAASRNLCDDLAENGDSTAEQIQKCHDNPKFGYSEYFKEQESKRKIDEAAKILTAKSEAEKSKIAATISENIETKKFTSEELNDAGFGKPFFAVTDDYRYGYKQNRVTEGNALCSYLGFEKAVKSIISNEINQEDSNKKGLIIDTGIFGGVKAPVLYKQEDPKVGVRKYVEITCVKRKDKKATGASDALKSIVEDLEILPDAVNAAPKDKTGQIVDDKRDTKKVTTPHGFKTPDWMSDDKATGHSK